VDGEAVGQVRLDDSDRGPEVALVVAPARRGRGLAAQLLRCLQEEVSQEAPTGMICAVVGVGNDRSKRAFRSVGFQELARDGTFVIVSWTW
jgi:RimJ/RimL family protein N-acetyltransferase